MAEGRTDPRAVGYALVDGLEDCVPGGTLYAADAVDRMLDALARAGFSVVPADDRHRIAQLAEWIERDRRESDKVLAYAQELRRIAGREDSK